MYYSEGNNTDFYYEVDGPVLEHASMDEILAHPWPTTDWFDYSEAAPSTANTRFNRCAQVIA
jgi:hypothetical protein